MIQAFNAVTPSDTVPLPQPAPWLYVGVAGDVAVKGQSAVGGNGSQIDPVATVFKACPQGWMRFPVVVAQVMATGTTATNLVASVGDQTTSH